MTAFNYETKTDEFNYSAFKNEEYPEIFSTTYKDLTTSDSKRLTVIEVDTGEEVMVEEFKDCGGRWSFVRSIKVTLCHFEGTWVPAYE